MDVGDDPGAVIAHRDVDVVVEAMGGLEPARRLLERALVAGRPVVTANKALLGAIGPELRAVAAARGVPLRFEAAVAAGVPVIAALSALAAGGRITKVEGALSGTATYVLSHMACTGASLDTAVRAAQQHGYAEADPARDLDGRDAADKLALLCQVAFGHDMRTTDVHRLGIDWLTADDVARARTHGRSWQLVATATADGCARVEPAQLAADHPFAGLHGVDNGVRIWSDTGVVSLAGPGAGGDATAAALLGDVAAAARDTGLARPGSTTALSGPRAGIDVVGGEA